MLGYAVYHAIDTPDTPPYLSARPLVDEAVHRGQSYVLPVEVRNHTAPTASNVRVAVTSGSGSGQTRRNEVQINYLPEHSKIKVFVVMSEKPTSRSVNARIESYQLP